MSSGTRTGVERTGRRILRAARTPAAGLAVAARLMLASAVVAAPSLITDRTSNTHATTVRPLAAVQHTALPALQPLPLPTASTQPTVTRTVGPPIPAPVRAPGELNIPPIALMAYHNADRMMARAMPDCGVSWNLLAGIGRIESIHAFRGATDGRGTTVDPIYGPTLDGTLPGNEIIVASRGADGRAIYARAMGPMQFLPSTWAIYASDGDGDGHADPQNLFDSTLAAARYLCSGGLRLSERAQLITAVLRYNNSMAYTHNVLGWADAYATGVPPVALPPINPPSRPSTAVRAVSNPVGTGDTSTPQPDTGASNLARSGGGRAGSAGANSGASGSNSGAGGSSGATSAGSRSGAANSGASAPSTRSGSSGGLRGGSSVRSGGSSSPQVTIGNGRTGGAR